MNIATIIFLIITILFLWGCFNFDDLYYSVKYKKLLTGLLGSIKLTKVGVEIAAIGLSMKIDPEKEENLTEAEKAKFIEEAKKISKDMVDATKQHMVRLDKQFKEIMLLISNNPTKYTFIYDKVYRECVDLTDNLRSYYIQNFGKYYITS